MENSKAQGLELINIRKVLKEKNPALYKMVPNFLIEYLRRIVHEESINNFLKRTEGHHGLEFIDDIMDEFKFSAKVVGMENIPAEGRYLVASNHPLGGLDGIALIQQLGKKREDILFPVNDILMHVAGLRDFFIPVNKHGSNADNIRILNDSFASDKAMLFFPAGLVSRKNKGIVADLEWKKTYITKCRKYERDIIPCHISGLNSKFFYRLANIRKKLGVKANIEMLYLVDEFYKQKNNRITITFGKPVSYQFFDKRKSDKEWASSMREHIYQLSVKPDMDFTV